jgi:flagellar biogenesis protein FliO
MLGFRKTETNQNQAPGGLAGWLLARLQGRAHRQPRLEVIERISLAPRQSLALVEAEGRRFLVACSADSTPAFYPIDAPATRAANPRAARVSW